MTTLELEKIYLTAGKNEILKDVNLYIDDKDFFVLLGPSGCGKTSTLRVISGLMRQVSGKVLMDGEDISDRPPSKRNISMVFQDYALYPHMTVFENIAFPLRIAHREMQYIRDKVKEISKFLAIDHLVAKKPHQISGGERQRVAIARALVKDPKLLLMDEPLSNLDAKLRDAVRFELKRIHMETGVTTVYVTHDQLEAMTLGNRIAIFRSGTIEQVGHPMEIFNSPVNTFVASFVGNPSMNILESEEAKRALEAETHTYAGIRPRAMFVRKPKDSANIISIEVKVLMKNLLGNEVLVQSEMGNELVYFYVHINDSSLVNEGKTTTLYADRRRIYLFDKDGKQEGRVLSEEPLLEPEQ
ncbi:MAG: ABC transporter ATP-binding protein [Candidatus Thermoplasmatota archaeon]|jgi:ABC-type sugar transport system ATPase subunit|nr:ABC transporter ATP-binding protein [Candidatus Thermoplasmatota archaeon]MCL5786197.1 ABC transporter ATP-binding protein [Candidatus Thermoplasmatota archaeon]